MTGTCSKSDCGYPNGLGCDNGETSLENCRYFKRGEDSSSSPIDRSKTTPDSGEKAFRLPWTGRALGLNDLFLASARSGAELIALVGPYNAGKTALLTSMFVHLAKLGAIGDSRFAGSFSLEGWSLLREYTKWPNAHGHSFPPHTPDSNDRVPSLLHLAFRKSSEPVKDYLFTDAPGEWFTRWQKKHDADDAKGARWIVENASRFVYVVDREGLAGNDRQMLSHTTRALARVLAEHRRDRPIIAAWTKSDQETNATVERAVRSSLQENFGDHPSLNLSALDGSSVELLHQLLTPLAVPERAIVSNVPSSPFCAYRGGRP